MIARATMSRWAMPPDSAATGSAAAVGEAELLEPAGGLGLRGARAHPEEPAVEVEVLPHAERAVERVGLRDHADHLLGRDRVGDDVDAADERARRSWGSPGW